MENRFVERTRWKLNPSVQADHEPVTAPTVEGGTLAEIPGTAAPRDARCSQSRPEDAERREFQPSYTNDWKKSKCETRSGRNKPQVDCVSGVG